MALSQSPFFLPDPAARYIPRGVLGADRHDAIQIGQRLVDLPLSESQDTPAVIPGNGHGVGFDRAGIVGQGPVGVAFGRPHLAPVDVSIREFRG